MKHLPFAILLLLSAPAFASEAPAPPVADPHSDSVDEMVQTNSLVPAQVLAGRHLWLEAALREDLVTSGPGAQLGVGYRLRYFGVDARLAFGKSQYHGFSVAPGASQFFGANDASDSPDSELNRPRSDSDPWSYLLVEPGLSVSGQLFERTMPWLTERARVGFAYGNFNDQNNDVPFNGYLFTAEAALAAQLGASSPWSAVATLNWNTGILVAKTPEDQSLSYRRLPVNWVGASLGLQYAF